MTLQAARSAVVLLSMLFTLVAAIAIPTTQQCNLQGREDVPSGLVFFSAHQELVWVADAVAG